MDIFSKNTILRFFFSKDKDQRSMDVETAKLMLNLLLGKQWKLYSLFAKFIDQSKYRVINKDQWCNILEFSRSISTDLSNYDIDGACKSFKNILFLVFVALYTNVISL